MIMFQLKAKRHDGFDGRVQRGFTLIELLIAVAVVGIILAIALPSYTQYVNRSNRTEGKNFLARLQAAQERYYTNYQRYATDITAPGAAGLGFTSATSGGGLYTAAVTNPTARSYVLTITSTFSDAECTTMSIDNLGVKTSTGTGTKCW